MLEQIHFKDQQSFRNWLKENHDKSDGFWMLYYKKHTKKQNIKYSDALDEALCFGWIDSIIKRIDEDRYLRKFTPRKNTMNWSEINKVRALKLIDQERMTIAGLQKIDSYLKTGEIKWFDKSEEINYRNIKNTPDYISQALKENPPIWEHFKALSPGYRKDYIRWVTDAKREETREKRLNDLIERLKKNRKPDMI
jgi:uncharacterized protein YdeI (YjbR/CyaY-like superfamily)